MSDVDAIRKRLDFVTGVPWPLPWVVEEDVNGDGHWDNKWHVGHDGGRGMRIATFEFPHHAELFADAPADLAWLCDRVEALEVDNRRLRTYMDDSHRRLMRHAADLAAERDRLRSILDSESGDAS